MGKSGVSCFRIMSCGGDRADEDDSGRPEVKSPVDKHRWSFKRKLSRRQIPYDCPISEPMLSVGKKATPEATDNDSHLPSSTLNQERLTVAKCLQDTPPLSPPLVDIDVSASVLISEGNNFDSSISESVATVIQSAVRAYLAGKDLQKRKSVVKLQAAVRGHLARREAVATLRCVQAIVKMQSLVRGRRKRLIAKAQVERDERMNTVRTEGFGADQKKYSPTEILLRNGFARLLLESKPKTKPIYISCEPLKSDSAWKWLERWMAAGCKGLEEVDTEESYRDSFVTSNVPSESSASVASLSIPSKSEFSTTEGEVESLINRNVDSCLSSKMAPERFPRLVVKGEEVLHVNAEVLSGDLNCQTGKNVQVEVAYSKPSEINIPLGAMLNDRIHSDTQNINDTSGTVVSESRLNVHEESVHTSKRLCNPEFVYAKSRPEELPPVSSSPAESAHSREPTDQSVISECQTVDSSTSNINSRDGSQCSDEGIALTFKASEGKEHGMYCDSNSASTPTPGAFNEIKVPDESDQNRDIGDPSVTTEQMRGPPNETTDSVSAIEKQAYITSPEMSPRSHQLTAESLGTPLSQNSTSTKTKKTERKPENRKQKIKLESKKTPAKRNAEATANILGLSPEVKHGKRSATFVTSEVDDAEHEPRSSISNSLPSYMQPTESARAKFHSSNSPRASHDDSDKDKLTIKRHSLPTGTGSEDLSSHTQRAATQVLQKPKGNATHSPQTEKRWVR